MAFLVSSATLLFGNSRVLLLLVYLILKERFEGLFYGLYELDSQKRHDQTSLKVHNVHSLILGKFLLPIDLPVTLTLCTQYLVV